MSRTRWCLLTAATVLAALLVPQGTPAAAAATFTEDFNGAAGSGVNTSRWSQETGNNGGNNHELQWYTSGTSNAALDGNGHLVITAKRENIGKNCWNGPCQYTSARLNTAGKFTQTYGHFEARIQIPRGQGMWPAFWMLGNNIGSAGWPGCGEIDIMENVGFEPRTIHGTLHGPGYSGGSGLGSWNTLSSGAYADTYHVYSIDWSSSAVVFSVDGHVYGTKRPSDAAGKQWVFNHPFFIIINLAVGGDWPGSPNGSTVFPQQMKIDYVHVTN